MYNRHLVSSGRRGRLEYLKCPEVETDIGHGVSPERLRNIFGQSEVARNQHENTLVVWEEIDVINGINAHQLMK